MGTRIVFLTRLVGLKLAALFTFVILSLYTPSTTNTLLDRAGGVSKLLAKGTEGGLQVIGASLGDVNALMPKRGAVELTFRFVAVDKVILFIGITITLYLIWLLVFFSARAAKRRLFDALGTPRHQETARVQAQPPR